MSEPVRPGLASAASTIWPWREQAERTNARRRVLQRGGLLRGVVGLAAAIVLFFVGRYVAASVVVSISALTSLLALVSPTKGYAALSAAVDTVGSWVGTLFTWVLLVPVFLLFFVPFGLIARRGANDRLQRRIDRTRPSYWLRRESQGSLEKPY